MGNAQANTKQLLDLNEKAKAAIAYGRIDDMQSILSKAGASIINYQDENGNTFLHLTVLSSMGNREMIQLLLNHGADVSLLNKEGESPYTLASHVGQFDIAELFESLIVKVEEEGENKKNSLFDVDNVRQFFISIDQEKFCDNFINDGYDRMEIISKMEKDEIISIVVDIDISNKIYEAINSKTAARPKPPSAPHPLETIKCDTVNNFFITIGLEKYTEEFMNDGYDRIDIVQRMTKQEISEIISIPDDVDKIYTGIEKLNITQPVIRRTSVESMNVESLTNDTNVVPTKGKVDWDKILDDDDDDDDDKDGLKATKKLEKVVETAEVETKPVAKDPIEVNSSEVKSSSDSIGMEPKRLSFKSNMPAQAFKLPPPVRKDLILKKTGIPVGKEESNSSIADVKTENAVKDAPLVIETEVKKVETIPTTTPSKGPPPVKKDLFKKVETKVEAKVETATIPSDVKSDNEIVKEAIQSTSPSKGPPPVKKDLFKKVETKIETATISSETKSENEILNDNNGDNVTKKVETVVTSKGPPPVKKDFSKKESSNTTLVQPTISSTSSEEKETPNLNPPAVDSIISNTTTASKVAPPVKKVLPSPGLGLPSKATEHRGAPPPIPKSFAEVKKDLPTPPVDEVKTSVKITTPNVILPPHPPSTLHPSEKVSPHPPSSSHPSEKGTSVSPHPPLASHPSEKGLSNKTFINPVVPSKNTKIEGFLTKSGKGGKDYKKRWCVLGKDYIDYFDTKASKKPNGTVDLSGATLQQTIDVSAASPPLPFHFQIVDKAGRVWTFCAESDSEKAFWYDAIRNIVGGAPLPSSSSSPVVSRSASASIEKEDSLQVALQQAQEIDAAPVSHVERIAIAPGGKKRKLPTKKKFSTGKEEITTIEKPKSEIEL